jgi:DnaJ family protein C protein 9
MEDDSHIANQIYEVFGDQSLYEILGINKDANSDEIKKAYRKAALTHHPDKGGNSEKFKAISAIHAILSDPEKRKIYDETGNVDNTDISDDFQFWYDYFRQLYPEVTISKIEAFSAEYKGSEEERSDIIAAYIKYEGDMDNIMETIMLAEEEDEPRIISIIDNAISAGEIERYRKYSTYCTKTKKKGRRKASKVDVCEDNDEALANMILGNRANRQTDFEKMFAKYTEMEGEGQSTKSGKKNASKRPKK